MFYQIIDENKLTFFLLTKGRTANNKQNDARLERVETFIYEAALTFC